MTDAPRPASPLPPGGIELAPGVTILPADLRLQYARSSGPGGQNVNKVNSKAELWAPVTAISGLTDAARQRLRHLAGPARLTLADEIHLSCDTHRSQEANRQALLDLLRSMLLEARRQPKVRRKTRPSRASRQRRLDAKRLRSDVKRRRQSPMD